MLEACVGADPIDVAEGYRWVTQTLRTALELYVENSPGSDVHLVPLIHPTRKGIGDNPDVLYDIAPLDREHAYRIRGRRGDAVYLGFCFYAMSAPGEMARWVFANRTHEDLEIDADGRYALEIGADPVTPSGVRLPAEPSLVIVRRYFTDRDGADRGDVVLEHAGPRPGHEPLTEGHLAEGLQAAARFVQAICEGPKRLVQIFGARTNELFAPPPQPGLSYPEDAPGEGIKFYYPTPDAAYPCGWFALEEDRALVVTVRPPESRYWSLHLMNRWFGSYDDGVPRRSVNSGNAALEPDGSCRVVISGRDPGVPNWLPTAGHPTGFALFRWIMADAAPTPACEVVPLDRVRA